MTRRLVILGSGTSFGVPVIGCQCDVCTSDDQRDQRTRVSAIVEGDDGQRILIDTPPELRLQLVAARVNAIDAVLYTHDHADHVHGIDDLRALSAKRGTLPLYGPADVLQRIRHRFKYIFDENIRPMEGTSKPDLAIHPLAADEATTIAGMEVLPLPVEHGRMTVFGYRFGDAAYLTDAKHVPPQVLDRLQGVRVFVINALLEKPHSAHLSIPEAIEVAQRVGAEQTYLTHLTHHSTHRALMARLPDGVEPAYDGLTLTF